MWKAIILIMLHFLCRYFHEDYTCIVGVFLNGIFRSNFHKIKQNINKEDGICRKFLLLIQEFKLDMLM